jgi:hypothetical protein
LTAAANKIKAIGFPQAFEYSTGWFVCVDLPEVEYTRWIRKLAGSRSFREGIENRIANIFKETLRHPNHINITWDGTGAAFNTQTHATTFISRLDAELKSYTSNNIDTPGQALIMHTCLSIYMHEVMRHLEKFEEKPEEHLRMPDVKGMLRTTIRFDKAGVPELIRS